MIWIEAIRVALMAPAFSSHFNRALQMGYLITPLSSVQPFWPPFCLLFLPAVPCLMVLPWAKREVAKLWGSA